MCETGCHSLRFIMVRAQLQTSHESRFWPGHTTANAPWLSEASTSTASTQPAKTPVAPATKRSRRRGRLLDSELLFLKWANALLSTFTYITYPMPLARTRSFQNGDLAGLTATCGGCRLPVLIYRHIRDRFVDAVCCSVAEVRPEPVV